MTGVLAGYTYIITVVPVNILGDGYPNKTIGYLNIIIKCVTFASHISNVAFNGFTGALVSIDNPVVTTINN